MDDEITKKPDHMRLGAFFLACIMIFGYVFIVSVHAALPTNPLKLPLEQEMNMRIWLPQGWGFYSKDPREETLSVIQVQSGEYAVTWPNNRMENVFGLKRMGRSQGLEAGYINMLISDKYWKECDGDMLNCLNSMDSVEVLNSTPTPTICGDIGLVMQKAIPWAWSRSQMKINMPAKVVRLNIKCSGK